MYYPPNLSSKGNSRNMDFPFYRPPPITKVPVAYPPYTKLDLDRTSASAAEARAEVEAGAEPEPIEEVPIVRVSDEIHVIGFDLHAKLVAHALAGVPGLPPVQMLTRNALPLKTWGVEGRAVSIHDSVGHPVSSRNIICPNSINRPYIQNGPVLHNIIVSTAARAALPALYALRNRIDRRTTVCLIEQGLGLMERLNEKVFQVPSLRPNYVLCHSEHKLAKHSFYKYAVRHVAGRLLVHAVARDDEDADLSKYVSRELGSQHTRNLVRILSEAEELVAIDTPWPEFLRAKLPEMIFQSLADTISVILDCSYNLIRKNEYAMYLWDKMLNETIRIISALPEFKDRPELISFIHEKSFPVQLKKRLERRGDDCSHWIAAVRIGKQPPVDFMNGYFITRAKELGLDYKQNRIALSMVKARQTNTRITLDSQIPIGLWKKDYSGADTI